MRPTLLALALAAVTGSVAAALPNLPTLPPPDMDAPAATAVAPDRDSTAQAAAPASQAPQPSAFDGVLAGDWRAPANVLRDPYRHPRETLAFFGVTPGQDVIEIWPGGGWYAEILAPMLRDGGTYTGVIPDPEAAGDGKVATERRNQRLRDQFAKRPEIFGKARMVEVNAASPVLGSPASADVVLTFRNAHNWVMDGNEQAMFKAFFAVLRPGGTLGVVDHRAEAKQPPAEMKTSGYLPEAYVIALAEGAGFVLAGKSEANANPRDTKDYAEGVWTLPPTLALGDKERDKYLAIGESDRMTLRFTKPAK